MRDRRNYREEIKGHFDECTEEEKELVMGIVARFHYRNGTHHEDGSRGDIDITRNKLNDALAYTLRIK